MQQPFNYELRGNRVARLSQETIKRRATRFGQMFSIGRQTRHDMEAFVESLSRYWICIDPIADDEWLFVTDGICLPEQFIIRLPESTFHRLCVGEEEAVRLLLHELGHLLLAHKAVMHRATLTPASREEDAEWQADMFASYVLQRMGMADINQLTLDLGDRDVRTTRFGKDKGPRNAP